MAPCSSVATPALCVMYVCVVWCESAVSVKPALLLSCQCPARALSGLVGLPQAHLLGQGPHFALSPAFLNRMALGALDWAHCGARERTACMYRDGGLVAKHVGGERAGAAAPHVWSWIFFSLGLWGVCSTCRAQAAAKPAYGF